MVVVVMAVVKVPVMTARMLYPLILVFSLIFIYTAVSFLEHKRHEKVFTQHLMPSNEVSCCILGKIISLVSQTGSYDCQ
jgi:hypothetical protein